MRIAVLILAHKNRNQLQLLVERLQSDFDVYIHLDKKSDLSEKDFAQYPGVFCIKKYDVNWGSYNGVLAPMELFKMAVEKDYDYYIHISGQDLPVKSNKAIIDFLTKNKNISFMDWEALPRAIWGKEGGFGRISYYWEYNIGSGFANKLIKTGFQIIRKIQAAFNLKRKLPEIPLFGGSNWVNINKEAGAYLRTYLNEHPDFVKLFKHSANADEMWLQTILKSSNLNFEIDYLRYVVWSAGKASPETLTMKDLPDILNYHGLFARKFDETVDNDVIREILNATKE
jgi:hypothetical protein